MKKVEKMNEKSPESEKKPPIHNIRISRGRRKGQFMKRTTYLNYEKKKTLKSLSEENFEVSSNTDSSSAGREIIETSTFSKQMWCRNCYIPLSLNFVIDKVQRGLGCEYTVQCCKCSFSKVVYTNSMFGDKKQYPTVNAKAVLGMIDSGIEETQFNSLLSSLNISPVSSHLIKKYKRMVGKKVENVALESCSNFLNEEKMLTKAANDLVVDK